MSPAAVASLPPLSISVLFRGVFGSLVGQIPYGMLTFGSYEILKAWFLKKLFHAKSPSELQLLGIFVVAAIIGDLSGYIFAPL